ncbi:hypothetical protein DRH14_01220 [Candidatus Shapirobacteria bacterium]|nr:MAG: hypothetical protein DRH14_01220 [Candidatus Shapirobacteria bacterium]
MTPNSFFKLIQTILSSKSKPTFFAYNFGCRVNASETNHLSQIFLDYSFRTHNSSDLQPPDVVLVNTCAITNKGEKESLRLVNSIHRRYPHSHIIATGCANLKNLKPNPQIHALSNLNKSMILDSTNNYPYAIHVPDKLSQYRRYLLKIQSGCNQFCSYCIVPYRRSKLWYLPIKQAIDQVNQAHHLGFQEIIITGVNLDLYTPKLSNLLQQLLQKTKIPLFSFGSIPINSINSQFISLLRQYPNRISNFLHIPIQSASSKILKLMNRPYNQPQVIKTFQSLQPIPNLSFGTDVLVAFPGETDQDFQQTYQFCQQTKFKKIHTFVYSPRPQTQALKLVKQHSPISTSVAKQRSKLIRDLVS